MTPDHLTEPNPELAALQKATPDGMAHWAGTGPAGSTCGGCMYFAGRRQKLEKGFGDLQPGRCRKFARMIRAAWRTSHAPLLAVEPTTPSCRHWAPKPIRR